MALVLLLLRAVAVPILMVALDTPVPTTDAETSCEFDLVAGPVIVPKLNDPDEVTVHVDGGDSRLTETEWVTEAVDCPSAEPVQIVARKRNERIRKQFIRSRCQWR